MVSHLRESTCTGLGGGLLHTQAVLAFWSTPGSVKSLGGRLTSHAIFVMFISQLFNDKIKFGLG